jgi:hypothetical protein
MTHSPLQLTSYTDKEMAVCDHLFKMGEAIAVSGSTLLAQSVEGVYRTVFDSEVIKVPVRGRR